MKARCNIVSTALELTLAAIGVALGLAPLAYVDGRPVTGLWGADYLHYARILHAHYIVLLSASVALAIVAVAAREAPADVHVLVNAVYMNPLAFLTLDVMEMPAGALRVQELVGNGILEATLYIAPSRLAGLVVLDGVPVLLLASLAAVLYGVVCRARLL